MLPSSEVAITDNAAETGDDAGASHYVRTLALRSGGTLTLALAVEVLALSDEDWVFLTALRDLLEGYTRGGEGEIERMARAGIATALQRLKP